MENATITEYLDNDYKEYAKYVIENRAIPSVIDGLKPTQRKVVHAANRHWKNDSVKPMKVYQLGGKIAAEVNYHHGDCLDPNTEILLADGNIVTIKDWYDNHKEVKLKVLSYDEELKKFVEAVGHSPRIGKVTNLEYEIEMEDGSIFKCTDNHPFLTNRGWVEAKDLTEDDEIVDVKS